MMKEQHVGSDFDEFLEEEGLLEETEAVVTKRLLAHEIAQAIEEQTDQVNYGGSR